MYVRYKPEDSENYIKTPVLVITDTSIFDSNRDYFISGIYKEKRVVNGQETEIDLYQNLINRGYWRDEPFKGKTAGIGIMSNFASYEINDIALMVPLINGAEYWLSPSKNPNL